LKRLLIAAALLGAAGCRESKPPVAAVCAPAPAVVRQQILLSDGWRFGADPRASSVEAESFDDRAFSQVAVPHTWGAAPMAAGWYRRRLDVTAEDLSGRVYLHFEGAAILADVWVNGAHLGQHRGAYTRFLFDATPHLRPGSNVLAVRVNNRLEDTADTLPSGKGKQLYLLYGGLYRKVWLLKTPALHVDPTDHAASGVFVSARDVTPASATLDARVRVRNAGAAARRVAVRVRLCDRDQREALVMEAPLDLAAGAYGEASLSARLERPRLWGPSDPHLYSVRAEVVADGQVVDLVHERTGVRDFQLKDGAFFLNGQPILLRGIGKHQETERSLSAISDDELREDFANLSRLGVNTVRLAHYPHAPLAYELADERGILVWAENGHSNSYKGGATGDRITREMVRQNFNHPSIVIWSAGNETGFIRVNRYAGVLQQEDATRVVAYASNTGVRGKQRYPHLDLIAQNTYRGWYRGVPWEFEEKALEMRYVSESGGGAVVSIHTDYADARHEVDVFEPEEYRQLLAEVHFQNVFRDHPRQVPMYMVWILRDFGIDKYKGWNTKGLLTAANFPKDAFFLYQSFLRPDHPVVHLTSKTYFLRRGRADNGIKAYSNRPLLRLTVNGVDLGARRNGEHKHAGGRVVENVFYWPAPLRAGRNDVAVDDGAGHRDSAVFYFAPPGATPPAGDAALVQELRSSNPQSPAWFIGQPVQAQWPFHWELDGSADNTFDTLPPEAEGARWIATRRLSKPGARTDLSFRLAAAADVFVMITRGQPLPPGLLRAGFRDTGASGLWRDNDMKRVPYALYVKAAAGGERVTVRGATADYVVLVRPAR
jgi:beta-galactosidase